MNDILHAEQDINNYLFHKHDTCVNFVARQFEYKPMHLNTDYAIQCTTRDGLFQKMEELVQKLGIEHSIFKDKATVKCIVLKKPEDVLKIASHIKEVKL